MRPFSAEPVEYLTGYVTSLTSISRMRPAELEDALGFGHGALAGGYYVYELAAPIALTDFEWGDQTAYSDGWHWDPTIQEFVHRQDELRAHYGKVTNYSEQAADSQIERVLRGNLARLTAGRIVKIKPKLGRPASFPNSPTRNVPQWRLRSEKVFRRLAEVAPGGLCP